MVFIGHSSFTTPISKRLCGLKFERLYSVVRFIYIEMKANSQKEFFSFSFAAAQCEHGIPYLELMSPFLSLLKYELTLYRLAFTLVITC